GNGAFFGRQYGNFLAIVALQQQPPATKYPFQKERGFFLEPWANHADIVHCVIAVSPRYAAPFGRFLPETQGRPSGRPFFLRETMRPPPPPPAPISSRAFRPAGGGGSLEGARSFFPRPLDGR